MRSKIIGLLLCSFCGFTALAQKELSLKQAVLEKRKSFAPTRMLDVQWRNEQSFSIVDHKNYQTLYIVEAKSGDTTQTIKKGAVQWPDSTKLRAFYGARWIDESHFRIQSQQKLMRVNIENMEVEVLMDGFTPKAENYDYTSETGNMAFTKGNNLYVHNGEKVIPITNFEDENIVSGQAIHRVEFGITKGTFWSDSGEKLAYYQKDESMVSSYPILDIEQTPGALKPIKYPMAGQTNQEGNVFVFDMASRKTVKLEKQGGPEDFVTNVSWSPDGKYVLVAELNRAQNHMHLNQFDASTGKFIKTLFEQKRDTWVEPEDPAVFLDNTHFLWLSERDGYKNIYLYNIKGEMLEQLTAHPWVVTNIKKVDQDNHTVFYEGTGDNPLNHQLFAMNWKTGKQHTVTQSGGTHRTMISPSSKYVLDQWSAKDVPRKVELLKANGKVQATLLEANDPLEQYNQPQVEVGTIKAADEQTDLYYRMIKPHDFDASKKYPVLVYVYGGPHAQMITNSYRSGASLWMHWMAQQGYIVFTVDGRGSAHRGLDFESVVHRHLGDNEMADQLEGVKFLSRKKYVDTSRMAVHGWSFGGFMTTSLMLRHPGIFDVGVAGGPVTDWKWYEIMYGERYMDRPEENEQGYEKASLMQYADQLEGDLLLIHGTNDDVVVMQHNLALVKAFVEAGKQMDFFPYPMHKHNVRGKDRLHLMRKVLTYVLENLKG